MNYMMNTKKLQHDKGFLVYNFDTETTNYSKITKLCIEHLKHHMPDIPVAVCGDHVEGCDIHIDMKDVKHNKRSYVHNNDAVSETWLNLTRDKSFAISPFEQTILMDSDYIVLSDHLMTLFDSSSPFLMPDKIYNIKEDRISESYLGESKVLQKWATLVKFDKSDITEQFFQFWSNALKNYEYYMKLFKWKNDGTVWNDNAISIAHAQITDYNPLNTRFIVPWPVCFASFKCEIDSITMDQAIIKDQKSAMSVNEDVHILNKQDLLHSI